MKLKCTCGHIIVDQTDNLQYKGYILPDTQVDKVSASLTNNIEKLVEAIKSGKQLEWIKENFHDPHYPIDLDEASMIHDLLSRVVVDTTQHIFQCESCGRIAIETGQTNLFKFFSPDSTGDAKGILNGGK